MATPIVSPFVADEIYSSSARAKCISIADAWLGANSTAAVSTWGDYHALINPVLTAASLTTIANGITGQQWLDRMNALNDAEQVLTGFGLLDWWDAERADLISLSGSAVTAWASTRNGYSAAQAVGASRPIYSATSFNGRPGVTFDGSDDQVTYAGVGVFPTGASAGEIWVLVDQTTPAATTGTLRMIAYGGVTTNDSRHLARTPSSGVNVLSVSVGTGASSTSNATPTSQPFSGRHVGRGVYSGTTITPHLDGIAPLATAGIPATGASSTRLGAGVSGVGFFGGVINFAAIGPTLSATPSTYLLNYLKFRGSI